MPFISDPWGEDGEEDIGRSKGTNIVNKGHYFLLVFYQESLLPLPW